MLVAAAALAPDAIRWGKHAWSGYKVLKAGVDKADRFRHAPAVMRYTCDLCAALLEPMAVAEALATRHRALRIVGPALLLAQSTVARFNALVTEPEDDTEKGWASYLSTAKEGFSKFDQLMEMQQQLSRAASALQLALQAVSVSSLPPCFAISPFRYLRDAFEKAQDSYLQLEMGRQRKLPLCGGEVWQRGIAVSTRGRRGERGKADKMQRLFDCRVSLQRGAPTTTDDEGSEDEDEDEDGGGAAPTPSPNAPSPGATPSDALSLRFEARGGDGSERASGGASGEERCVPLDETVQLRRRWAHEMELGDEFLDLVGEDALCCEPAPPFEQSQQGCWSSRGCQELGTCTANPSP